MPKIDYTTEKNPRWYGRYKTDWRGEVTSFLLIEFIGFVWFIKNLTNQSKYVTMVGVSSYYFSYSC